MPAPTLDRLLDPATTAVVTMELQRGVTGDLARMAALRDVLLADGTIDNAAALCNGARAAGVRVVHATAVSRPDKAGHVANCRMLAASSSGGPSPIEVGSPGAEVMPELGVTDADIVIERLHGMTPFMSTSLNQILRNLGVRTIVAAGNSVNIGVLGLVMNGVDLGYQVVVPRDAVAGVPREYADAVLDNTIAFLATVTTTAEILSIWS